MCIFNLQLLFCLLLCRRTKLQSEEIVAELVSSFLLPEVQKITMRENGKNVNKISEIFASFHFCDFCAEGNLAVHGE